MSSAEDMSCFKAYDVRGRVPDQLNEDVAYRIGRAFVEVLGAQRVVVGHDVRLSSESIKRALSDGLRDQGADVFDIGIAGTEEIYFATSHSGNGWRYRRDRQPQSERLQRYEIRSSGFSPRVRRHRSVRYP